jgi:hypothetical protein
MFRKRWLVIGRLILHSVLMSRLNSLYAKIVFANSVQIILPTAVHNVRRLVGNSTSPSSCTALLGFVSRNFISVLNMFFSRQFPERYSQFIDESCGGVVHAGSSHTCRSCQRRILPELPGLTHPERSVSVKSEFGYDTRRMNR